MQVFRRRRTSRWVAVLFAGLAFVLSSCGGQPRAATNQTGQAGQTGQTGKTGQTGSSPQHIRIATTSTAVQLLLVQIADKKGFFAKHGLQAEVTVVNGDAASIPAVQAGSVDFAVCTTTPFLKAVTQGSQMQMITTLSTFPEQVVMRKALAEQLGIRSDSPLEKKVQALKGRSVAVLDIGGGLHYTLNAVLKSAGIDPNQVRVVAIKPYSAELTALQRGQVDAIAPSIPYGQIAVARGDAVMIADVWGGEVPNLRGLPFEVVAVRKDWASGHKDVVEAVRAAFQDAIDFVRNDPAGAAAFAHELNPTFPLDVLQSVIGKGEGYPVNTQVTPGDFKRMQDFAATTGVDASHVTYDDAVWPGARTGS